MHVVAFALAVGAGLTLARAQGRLAPADEPDLESSLAGVRSHGSPAGPRSAPPPHWLAQPVT
jgi:hypothetical protein